jgi:hypothetical protein
MDGWMDWLLFDPSPLTIPFYFSVYLTVLVRYVQGLEIFPSAERDSSVTLCVTTFPHLFFEAGIVSRETSHNIIILHGNLFCSSWWLMCLSLAYFSRFEKVKRGL